MVIKESLKELIRLLPVNPDPEIGISRFGSELDLVYTDTEIFAHTDNDGSDRSNNVLSLCLMTGGRNMYGPEFGFFQLSPGSIQRFDGSIKHALLNDDFKYPDYHRSAFIIWDVSVDRPTKSFISGLRDRMEQLEFEIRLYLDTYNMNLSEGVICNSIQSAKG